ncbi:hypothetical protein ACGF0J_33410 [Nonomuraea sp. NPDC047897]|uniref:hypothetical protein n=1 Tax=Nonomuraea sp. NPDC047897 TaxID=3364346 RepID=UPI0037219C2F
MDKAMEKTSTPATGSPAGPGRLVAPAGAAAGGAAGGRAHRTWRGHPLTRWLPAAAVAAFTAAVLSRYGVSAADLALFAGYVALGLALPGVLTVRALYGRSRTPAEEVALGLPLGYAVEILAYVGARAAGLPLLVLVWPLATYAAFLAVPSLRRHWRAGPRPAAPWWWPSFLALVTAALVAWSAVKFFATHAVTWPALGTAAPDMPFHLALVGELRHHVPPVVPMVAGEPLAYHWFVYAHLAAASHVTGVEPLILLFRLGMLPMLAALVVLAGLTGRRLTRTWSGAAVTVVGTVFVGAPSLYLGANGLFTWGGIPDTAWISPTQTLGALLFAAVVLVLLDLLEDRPRDVRAWCLAAVLLVALTGAKATYLPLLGAGLAVVAGVRLARGRRPSRPVLVGLGLTAVCVLFAQFVLFGRARQGIVVDPFSFIRVTWSELTGAAGTPAGGVPGMAAVYLVCWVVTWLGIVGLAVRPAQLARPAVTLMLGVGGAGLAAALLFGHPGRSQLFFLWGGYPCLAAVTAWGLILLVRWAGLSSRATAAAAGAGLAAAYLVPLLCGVTIPLAPGLDPGLLYRPYLVLVAAAVTAAALLAVRRGVRGAAALVVVALASVGLPAYGHARVLSALDGSVTPAPAPAPAPANADSDAAQATPATQATTRGAQAAQPPGRGPVAERAIPEGGLAAGRWLRAHSAPGDLVATNAHCRWGREDPCDSRFPWVSALAERRVLVEGWAYTAANLNRWRPGLPPESLPFWDPELLRLNDAAFRAPSADVMRLLRERHGVRWLFAEERPGASLGRIGDFAALRFRSGGYAVYLLPGSSPT